MMKDLKKSTNYNEKIDELSTLVMIVNQYLEQLAEFTEETESLCKLMTLEQQTQWIFALREAKESIEQTKICVNRNLESSYTIFTNDIANPLKNTTEECFVKTKQGTFTASAEGYYAIVDPDKFFLHCQKVFHNNEYIREFVRLSTHKRELQDYCNSILESGENVPDFIKYFIKPSVRVVKRK